MYICARLRPYKVKTNVDYNIKTKKNNSRRPEVSSNSIYPFLCYSQNSKNGSTRPNKTCQALLMLAPCALNMFVRKVQTNCCFFTLRCSADSTFA